MSRLSDKLKAKAARAAPRPLNGPLYTAPEQPTHGCTLILHDERGRVIARTPDMGSFERATKAYGPTFARLAECWNLVHEIHAYLDSEGEWDSDTMSTVANMLTEGGFPPFRDPNAEESDDE